MDQWLKKGLAECLGFDVPDDMIKYVLTLKEENTIDEYFETLLDVSVHRTFIDEFKKRALPKNAKNNNNRNKGNQNKSNVLKPEYEKVSSEKRIAKSSNTQSNSIATNEITKKKTKYVNLYGENGKMNDVITLKGRHSCNCEASKHKLINNCIQCGRIVCDQEGSGPCLYCGNLVCTDDEQRIIESSSQTGENLKNSLLKQGRPKGWEEALAMRNRLLDYDRTSEKRTTVIDDESDYFRTNSVWLSDEERAKLRKIEEKMKLKKHASRRDQKITIDFTGRQMIEEAAMSTEFENEILKEINDTFTHSNQGLYSTDQHFGMNFDNSEDCDPNLSVPAPIFDESVLIKINSHSSKYDGVYNRVQDKELLEVSDMKKCMSIHQPWASLLVAGIKKHEGRSWYTSHRGRLWIAATAKSPDPEEVKIMENFYRKLYNDESIEFPKQYPTASLLGCVLVQDCLPQEEYRSIHPNGESESPYVFICSNPQELPVKFPVRGLHKIYKLEDPIHIAAVKSLQRMTKKKEEEDK
ncbi:activating signal cointegrator 1 [Contarinia nasturtii]|uniref:activating signal cointegrator 1 n=1 Tax=Contarinia nasturtii TaxID=265458 RepID=UPI0012D3B83C|nr:activating signal cointegrator 1 [Contarinia nasturtii]